MPHTGETGEITVTGHPASSQRDFAKSHQGALSMKQLTVASVAYIKRPCRWVGLLHQICALSVSKSL